MADDLKRNAKRSEPTKADDELTDTATVAADAEAPAEPLFTRPKVEVLDRRLQSPFGSPSASVALTEPGWVCRWFNAALAADRIWKAKHEGWQGVLPAELADREQIGGFQVSPDGFVVRGDKGQELLMKLPADWQQRIATAKAEQNTRNMRPGVMKREVAEAAGRAMGDEAGSFVDRNVQLVGTVTDSRERIHRTGELE